MLLLLLHFFRPQVHVVLIIYNREHLIKSNSNTLELSKMWALFGLFISTGGLNIGHFSVF